MKGFFFAIIFLALKPAGFANDPTREIVVPVQSVIVYLDGAEISQSKKISLTPGRNMLVFTGLSQKLISKSIQVNVGSDVSILSVSDQINYLAKQEDIPRVKQLKDSVQVLNDDLVELANDQDAYDTEKKLLLENKNLSGKDKSMAVNDLKALADFYLARIKEVNDAVSGLEKKENKLKGILSKTKKQLQELNAKFSAPSNEVSILLFAQAATTTTVELKYIVTDAGWVSSYDLRAEDVTKPIELKYRAKVFNNTGVNWNDVKLRLSTADPMRSVSKPVMDTWYLNYANQYSLANNINGTGVDLKPPVESMHGNVRDITIDGRNTTENNDLDKSFNKRKEGKSPVQYEQIQVSELSADFDIKNPYSIPSDSKPYLVDVTTYNLPAVYKDFSAPKVDKDVYLLARITGWEDLDLVPGPANVYYGGTYVGQSYINSTSTDDTLDLSLGRDTKIAVTRIKQKDFSTQKLIGSTKKEMFAYEITVKNNRKIPVQLELNDQLPVSQQGDIMVDEIELSKAEKDVVTGKLTWKLNLQPDELKKINLAFSIKYPKNKTVSEKKYRTMTQAQF